MLKKNKLSKDISFIDESSQDSSDKTLEFYKTDSFFWKQLSNILPNNTFSHFKKFLSLKITQEEKIKEIKKKYYIETMLFPALLSFKDNVGSHSILNNWGRHILQFLLTFCAVFILCSIFTISLTLMFFLLGIFFSIDSGSLIMSLGNFFFHKYSFFAGLSFTALFYILDFKDEINKERKVFNEYQSFLSEMTSQHSDILDLNILDMFQSIQACISNERIDNMIASMEKEPKEKLLVRNFLSIDNITDTDRLDTLAYLDIIKIVKETEKESNNIFSGMAMDKLFQNYINTIKNTN